MNEKDEQNNQSPVQLMTTTYLREVIETLVKLGLSVQDIAGELNISPSTVHKYDRVPMSYKSKIKLKTNSFSLLKNRLKIGDATLLAKIKDVNARSVKINEFEYDKELLIRCVVRDLLDKSDSEIAKQTGLSEAMVIRHKKFISRIPKLYIVHRYRKQKKEQESSLENKEV